jgi:hypothetical protein
MTTTQILGFVATGLVIVGYIPQISSPDKGALYSWHQHLGVLSLVHGLITVSDSCVDDW